MANFREISSDKRFQETYETAASFVRTDNFPYELSRVRVLDVGGGTGTFGRALEKSLDGKLDYFNIDLDGESLDQSPGTKIHADDMYEMLRDQGLFDVICLLNYNPILEMGRHFAAEVEDFRNEPSDFRRFIKPQTYESMRVYHRWISMLSASFLLNEGGILLYSNVMDLETRNRIRDDVGVWHMGLMPEEDVPLTIDYGMAKTFVENDGGIDVVNFFGGGMSSERLARTDKDNNIQEYLENLRLLVFRRGAMGVGLDPEINSERYLKTLLSVWDKNMEHLVRQFFNPHFQEGDDIF